MNEMNGGGDASIDKLFADMALLHAENEGEALHAENSAIGGDAPFALSAGFDKKVYNKIRMEKYRRPAYIAGALAAGIILMLVGANIFSYISGSLRYSIGGLTLVTGSPENERAEEDNIAVSANVAGPPGFGAASGTGGAQGAAYEMLPLSFDLPPNLSISNVTQDIGQTVFYINEDNSDDIVLIAEKSEEIGGTGAFDEDGLVQNGLTQIMINSTKVFAVAKADFSYLTFKNEGIIYSLACKYDYNTIIALCEYIL